MAEFRRTSSDVPATTLALDNRAVAAQCDPMTASPVTVFHNPRCSKSRAAVELVRAQGVEPEIVLYLQIGWSRARLAGLLARMGLRPRDILRSGEAEAAGLEGASDDMILTAMVAHPVLAERPIVETPKGVIVGRPPERVLEVL